MPRRKVNVLWGLRPSFGLWPKDLRAQPRTRGKARTTGTARLISYFDGKAEPCRTSGGEAATVQSITLMHNTEGQ
jgi:hypothetical protein